MERPDRSKFKTQAAYDTAYDRWSERQPRAATTTTAPVPEVFDKSSGKPEMFDLSNDSSLTGLHAAIMNLRCIPAPLRGPTQCFFSELESAYKAGHKDARQAAAELVAGAALVQTPRPLRELWLIACEHAVEFKHDPHAAKELGYVVVPGFPLYESCEQCMDAIKEEGFELGWVALGVSQLIPTLAEKLGAA